MKDKKITRILLFISALFLVLIVYLTSIEIFYRDEYSSSNLNSRTLAKEENVMRGTIYDRNGEVLAYSKMDEGVQKRYYPHISLYSHVIGYSSKTYGKSFIEKTHNSYLLGEDSINAVFNLKNLIKGDMSEGNDLYLTIDHPTQQKASSMMDKYRGALVALNPQTGEIIAMVSKPDFNPNETYLTKSWSELNSSEYSPFLNRATMGLYPPGSTFKTVTAAMLFDSELDGEVVNDETGKAVIDGYTLANTKNAVYGETDIVKAFTRSSNVYFATVGSHLSSDYFKKTAEKLMFNKKFGFDFPYTTSKFQTSKMTEAERAATAIGQGKTLMSPLHLAMVTGAIANGGKMMRPYIVSSVETPGGTVISKTSPSSLSNPISEEAADFVKELMIDTVAYGTGTNAQIPGLDVGGKTGTAENEKTAEDPEKTHALFVAFAPGDEPEIAVAVVLEYAGSTGGSIAAPIAREVIRTYLER